jgi:hypothetical protein
MADCFKKLITNYAGMKLTISKAFSCGPDGDTEIVSIAVNDSFNGNKVFDIRLECDDFAKCLTGTSLVDCQLVTF